MLKGIQYLLRSPKSRGANYTVRLLSISNFHTRCSITNHCLNHLVKLVAFFNCRPLLPKSTTSIPPSVLAAASCCFSLSYSLDWLRGLLSLHQLIITRPNLDFSRSIKCMNAFLPLPRVSSSASVAMAEHLEVTPDETERRPCPQTARQTYGT